MCSLLTISDSGSKFRIRPSIGDVSRQTPEIVPAYPCFVERWNDIGNSGIASHFYIYVATYSLSG